MKIFRFLSSICIILFSIIGFLASFALLIEKMHLLENPDIALSCSINSTFNCASVMNSWQSEVFGFSNPILGVSGYSITGTIGVYLLLHKKVHSFLLLGTFFGSLGAIIFSYWLLTQSIFVIGSLCPYCLASCFSATNIFITSLNITLKENFLNFPDTIQKNINIFLEKGWLILPVSIWYFIWITIIYFKFYY